MELTRRPVTLIIIDGWGVADDQSSSAIARADLPFYRSLIDKYPNTVLSASGEDVGLPEGQMGNSEVGHLNIGAGRIVYQDFTRINRAIRQGELGRNPALAGAMEKARGGSHPLHLIGLVSDGGVHSDIRHLFALLEMARGLGVGQVYVHAILDGRDTPPKSGLGYVRELRSFIESSGMSDTVSVATVSGRYYAMDRDNRWERVKLAYDAIALGQGRFQASSVEAVEYAYGHGETDEFVMPTVITHKGKMAGRIKTGDPVIFFNFRTDRTRELTRAIALHDFDGFERGADGYERPVPSVFVCMTEYDETFGLPVAFPAVRLENIFGEVISHLGLRQLRIAETEKYAHVTFFFNGGEERPLAGMDRALIPSPKDVPTYDLKPEMSAFLVTDELLKRIRSRAYDVIILNFANPDMVGHTGVMAAAVKACEAVDKCLARIVPAVMEAGGVTFITADHGNVEKMRDGQTDGPHTAHTLNLVPFIAVDTGYGLRERGILADVAPTLLEVMGIQKPPEMTGESLIKR